jgi:hypothetical protein
MQAPPLARERIHELKSWPEFFNAILEGRKRHELRRNDRDFCVGDVLRLREFHNSQQTYTGRETRVRITYITSVANPCAFFRRSAQ